MPDGVGRGRRARVARRGRAAIAARAPLARGARHRRRFYPHRRRRRWWVRRRGGTGRSLQGRTPSATGLPEETRTFLVAYSGIRDWPSGLLELLYSAALWVGAVLLLHILAIGKTDRQRVVRRLPLLAIVFVVLVGSAALGGAGGAVIFSAGPLVCAGAAAAALLRRVPGRAALLGFGLAGTLFFYRRPFHIGDAAYVGPPLLFAIVCAAGLVQLAINGETDAPTRERLRLSAAWSVFALVVLAFAGRAVRYAGDERIAVPGTGGSFPRTRIRSPGSRLLPGRFGRTTRPGRRSRSSPRGKS